MFCYLFVGYLMMFLSFKHFYDTYFVNTVYIIRGISGSGKSHLVSRLYRNYDSITQVELNMYQFLDKNNISSKSIVKAYDKCLLKYINCLSIKCNYIYITNTFIEKWEYEIYKLLAKEYGYRVKIIELQCNSDELLEKCFNRSENIDNFNLIKNLYDKFESDEHSEIIVYYYNDKIYFIDNFNYFIKRII